MSNRDPYSDCWKSPSQPRTRVTFADRVLQECSPDNNQNQGPEGYQYRMQTSMKCGLVEKVSLSGAHSRQTKVHHSAERAPDGRDGIGGVGGDFVQVGEKQEHAEA